MRHVVASQRDNYILAASVVFVHTLPVPVPVLTSAFSALLNHSLFSPPSVHCGAVRRRAAPQLTATYRKRCERTFTYSIVYYYARLQVVNVR